MNAIGEWRRGPAMLLFVGVAIFISAMMCGCATKRNISFDASNPAFRVSTQGILFGDRYIKPTDAPKILKDYHIPKTRTIHILLDPDVKNLQEARFMMGMLGKAGYTRPVLVTARHAESMAVGKTGKKPTQKAATVAQPRQIRYKKANEK